MRSLLFDLDGALVDSTLPIVRSMNHALTRLGLPEQPEASMLGYIGPPLVLAFRDVLGRIGADPAAAEECVGLYRERYAVKCVEETALFPGIADAVRGLAAERTLVVATSKPAAFAEPILVGVALRDCFRAVEGPSLDPQPETKADTVKRALARLGDPGGAPVPAIVGDRLHDVEAGRAHGLVTIGVTWGFGSEAELRDAGADHIVRAPADLPGLVRSLD